MILKNYFLAVALLLPFLAFCQADEKYIAEAVCSRLESLDLKQSSTTLNQQSLATIQQVYQELQPQTTQLFEAYRKKYKGKSDVELSRLIGQQVTVHLMDDCIPYQRITMFNAQPVPVISEVTRQIGESFTALLRERAQQSSVTQEVIDTCIAQITDNNTSKIEATFGERYAPQFIQEFQAYLMTECKPYIQWVASQIR